MPTEYVKKQLLSLEFAIPESYDEKTNTYFIPKYKGPIYEVGKCYLVHLIDLATVDMIMSWNNVNLPGTRYLNISVNTKLGKMIKVDAVEIDEKTGMRLNTMWLGWLNSDYLEQLSKLN